MAQKDLYKILGIERGVDSEAIKRAYRKLVKQYHPDRNKNDPEAAKKFNEVQQAYAVLTDAKLRQQYDTTGHAGPIPEGEWQERPGGQRVYRWTSSNGEPVEFDIGDLSDIFDMGGRGGGGGGSPFDAFFGGGGGGRRSQRGQRGQRGARQTTQAVPVDADIEQEATIDFDHAVRGTTLQIAMQLPGGGREQIDVRIPAGINDGQRVRVRGKGHPLSNGQRGDLYIRVKTRPHKFFRREGLDIYLDLPLSITEAALGATVDVPTLDGVTRMKVPPGTASGKKLRMTGRGIAGSGAQRGDQYALIRIVPPAKLTDAQRELLQKLADSGLPDPRVDAW